MTVLKVRRAVPTDATRLAQMRYEFRAAMNEATEARAEFVKRTADWMARRLTEDSPWKCWVVVDSSEAIQGHLWLQIIEKVPNPAPELEVHGYITNVYVDPDARGAGAGERLMDAAMAYCREARVDSVVLWPTTGSRTLYARHGFAVPEDMMEAILDEGRDIH